jgi:hypothetical protein
MEGVNSMYILAFAKDMTCGEQAKDTTELLSVDA